MHAKKKLIISAVYSATLISSPAKKAIPITQSMLIAYIATNGARCRI